MQHRPLATLVIGALLLAGTSLPAQAQAQAPPGR
jgi:peptide/nickel transport system substrate-binding protein